MGCLIGVAEVANTVFGREIFKNTSEAKGLFADISNLQKLKWIPKTSIVEGIQKTLEEENKNYMIRCTACSNKELQFIYRFDKAPIFNNVFFNHREAAKKAKTGVIELYGCKKCGLVFNAAFNSRLVCYTDEYNNAQNFSEFFMVFSDDLAKYLVKKYDLKDKNVVEIGCGKGNFVDLIYNLGVKKIIGFDPAYENYNPKIDRLIIKKYFNKNNSKQKADYVICRHTLEHVHKSREFASSVSNCLVSRGGMYFEVPDLGWIVKNKTFFDFTYEHCNYFTPYSLYNLFAQLGLGRILFKKGLRGQYIQAEIGQGKVNIGKLKPINFSKIGASISFGINNDAKIIPKLGKFIVWGAGGKGVFLLNYLKIDHKITDKIIDINKNKQGKFIPGMGQEVVSPEVLKKGGFDTVIIMNPAYEKEICQSAKDLGFKGKFVVMWKNTP